MSVPHVHEALKWASSFLESWHREKEIGYILLEFHTGWSRSRLLAEMQSPLPDITAARFKEDVMKAAAGTPVQHITGLETFYGRNFRVNPDVLIPRPETEELIEAVLKNVPEGPLRVADIGTGSGIIAITLALELPEADVTAVDISSEALETARVNAYAHGAEVQFEQGDLCGPLLQAEAPFDVIVSNPPYVPEKDRGSMDTNVKDHEPEGALFAGEEGLDIYRRLAVQLPSVLKNPGVAAFEIGHGQGDAVRALIKKELPEASVELLLDINEKERIILVHI